MLVQVVARLGKEINDESSVCYWAQKNNIPIFCPALTDGSLGDMLFFHTYKNPGLVIDLVEDIRLINDEALKAAPRKTGMIILGGGAALHCTLPFHVFDLARGAQLCLIVLNMLHTIRSRTACCAWHARLMMRCVVACRSCQAPYLQRQSDEEWRRLCRVCKHCPGV